VFLVSVIMPSLNSECYIGEAIESVLSQTFCNFELIIIDGGSEDNTIDIIDKYMLQDDRIFFINNINDGGPAHARQVGIQSSKGDYIAFLDADDYWLPIKLEVQAEFMTSGNVEFSYTRYRSISDNGDNLGCPVIMRKIYTFKDAMLYRGIGTLTVMLRRDLLSEYVINSRSEFAEDYLWWLLILKDNHVAKLLNIDTARYRNRKNSRSKNKFLHQLSLWRMYRDLSQLNIILVFLYYNYYIINTVFYKSYVYICSKIKKILL
jgi:teichuronic acid biosynthesis glycosyltransferase TuaG